MDFDTHIAHIIPLQIFFAANSVCRQFMNNQRMNRERERARKHTTRTWILIENKQLNENKHMHNHTEIEMRRTSHASSIFNTDQFGWAKTELTARSFFSINNAIDIAGQASLLRSFYTEICNNWWRSGSFIGRQLEFINSFVIRMEVLTALPMNEWSACIATESETKRPNQNSNQLIILTLIQILNGGSCVSFFRNKFCECVIFAWNSV